MLNTLLDQIISLLLSAGSIATTKDTRSFEHALYEISNSIRELADSINGLSGSIIATVQDEHELRHYGHLKTAVRSLAAARYDAVTLNDARIELDSARKLCVTGEYWLIFAEYERLSGRVSHDTLRHAFAYSRSNRCLKRIWLLVIDLYLFRISEAIQDPLIQEIFPRLVVGLDEVLKSSESRNSFAVPILERAILNEENLEMLRVFTQKPYEDAIEESKCILLSTKDIPQSIEELELPIMCVSTPVIADNEVNDRGRELISVTQDLERLIARKTEISHSMSKYSYGFVFLFLVIALILFAFGFWFTTCFVWSFIFGGVAIIRFAYDLFKRLIYRKHIVELRNHQRFLEEEWQLAVSELN